MKITKNIAITIDIDDRGICWCGRDCKYAEYGYKCILFNAQRGMCDEGCLQCIKAFEGCKMTEIIKGEKCSDCGASLARDRSYINFVWVLTPSYCPECGRRVEVEWRCRMTKDEANQKRLQQKAGDIAKHERELLCRKCDKRGCLCRTCIEMVYCGK